jgi:hypothetical protein
VPGHRLRVGLVAGQAGLDVLGRQPGLGGARVGGHGHGAGSGSTSQERAQALEGGHSSEVVDGGDPRTIVVGDPGGGHDAVEGAVAPLGDGLDHGGASVRCAQVGQHLGVAHVDADDGVALGLQALAQRATDAAG